MPRDIMEGMFKKTLKDEAKNPFFADRRRGRDVFPYFEELPDGTLFPHHFDNDKAIELYEENLQDLFENSGIRHDGIAPCAEGLAVLYDVKAGIEKDAKYYDK